MVALSTSTRRWWPLLLCVCAGSVPHRPCAQVFKLPRGTIKCLCQGEKTCAEDKICFDGTPRFQHELVLNHQGTSYIEIKDRPVLRSLHMPPRAQEEGDSCGLELCASHLL